MIIAHLSAVEGWAVVGLLAFLAVGVIALAVRQDRRLRLIERTAEAFKVLTDLCVLKKDKE